MNAVLTGVIGVAATLLGSFSTYLFQGRTARRAEVFARDERLRQEQLIACSAYAASLTDLKRGLIGLWFRRNPADRYGRLRHVRICHDEELCPDAPAHKPAHPCIPAEARFSRRAVRQ